MVGSGKALLYREPQPDLLFSNLELYNPFTCSWEQTSFSVNEGKIQNIGGYQGKREFDLLGARVVPGLIDAHVHIESSLLTPTEFGRMVLSHGTTTVIADPHEIANVLGSEGILYMLEEGKNTPLDIYVMLPSCVPASPDDVGGAALSAQDLSNFLCQEKVLGLGEVMDVAAVISNNPDMQEKLDLTTLIDGHAPFLGGAVLDAYIRSGIESDHECTNLEEAREKMRKGMFIMIREGSTEQNLRTLIPLVRPCSLSRCCFATDDRHAGMLAREGHIDDCIRKAMDEGTELETALRLATLSPCERFGIRDRGALAPGRQADFCILTNDEIFHVKKTFKKGKNINRLRYQEPAIIRHTFHATLPTEADLAIRRNGIARVIRLEKGQIITRNEEIAVEGERIPDPEMDLLKVMVCSRYRPGSFALGIVRGFGFQEGAIASSVAHDSHNVVAAGADDHSLRKAAGIVISRNGGMVVVSHHGISSLPLDCAGLMSSQPYPKVVRALQHLDDQTNRMGAIEQPFMYLSFLTLTVVPALRLTERGLYDVYEQTRVPLFSG
ncbi:MAG: adenine deaminase [Methanomicrobiales archaeon]|nr:adenine deaminase [Methanomicrobiales archaeon]